VIPAYHLYGENSELPDFLHCERIADRASKHGWTIEPHRHTRLHQFFWVKDRSLVLRLDGQRLHLPAGRVISLPIYRVHGFDFEPQTQGLVVTVAQEEVTRVTTQHTAVTACLSQPLIIKADAALDAAFAGIAQQFNCHDSLRPVMLRAQFLSLLGCLARAEAPLASRGGRAGDMVARLLDLARQSYSDTSQAIVGRHAQPKVSDYAQQLGVSSAHLNRLCRQASGQSPQALIEAVRMQEAKRLLAYTRMTVAEVGYRLGFDDPSYFARAFKRGQGVSPKAYREAMESRASS
jgi:AraC family transcriptional activator of pobA